MDYLYAWEDIGYGLKIAVDTLRLNKEIKFTTRRLQKLAGASLSSLSGNSRNGIRRRNRGT
jgi:hypothetical protein